MNAILTIVCILLHSPLQVSQRLLDAQPLHSFSAGEGIDFRIAVSADGNTLATGSCLRVGGGFGTQRPGRKVPRAWAVFEHYRPMLARCLRLILTDSSC